MTMKFCSFMLIKDRGHLERRVIAKVSTQIFSVISAAE